jgi:hypothetical protein
MLSTNSIYVEHGTVSKPLSTQIVQDVSVVLDCQNKIAGALFVAQFQVDLVRQQTAAIMVPDTIRRQDRQWLEQRENSDPSKHESIRRLSLVDRCLRKEKRWTKVE